MIHIVSTPYMLEDSVLSSNRLELVYNNLPAAMAQFYRRVGRYQGLTGEVLDISAPRDIESWQRQELYHGECIVAYHRGKDEIASAKIWVKRS